jgi:RimJ/RimL family protein N-acetyltransferase
VIIAQSPRLTLRQFHLDDAGAMGAVFGDPEVMRFGDGVRPAEWVRAWVGRWVEELYARWGFGMWAVGERSTSDLIGYCGLSRFDGRCAAGEAELGFRLARAWWGRGLATEAARAAVEYGLGRSDVQRVIALVDPQNVASIRVVEKVGMRYERDVMLAGYDHPDRVYAIGITGGG